MKPGKLLAVVRRELIANPKKAAALALLLATAVWFWGPIVWRMAGGKKLPATAPTQVVISQLPSAAPASNAAAPGRANADWRQLLESRRRDPLAQPAKFDPKWPQPFQVKVLATAAAEGAVAQNALTPAQAGLVLESILYGKSKRAAMINGEIYREGSDVAVAAATGDRVTFQVVRIDRARVELARYGRNYRLEFPRPRWTQSQAAQVGPHPLTPAADQP